MDYMRAYRNTGSIKHKARITALETFAVHKASNIKCYDCGKTGHVRKPC